MGRRGPKPKPSALDKLDGNASHRRPNAKEPKPELSAADCPKWLRGDPIARAIWASEAPRFIRLGLLTVADRLTFAALCERAALYRRAATRLWHPPKGADGQVEDALLTDTKANGKQARPEINIAKGALEGFRQLAAAFGMTPADRKGLEVDLGAGAAPGERPVPAKPTAGSAIEIDEFLRRREARRTRRPA